MAQPAELGTLQVNVGTNAVLSTPVPNTWQVPAVIRLRCLVMGEQCRIGDVNVTQGATISLAIPMAATGRFTRPPPSVLFRIRRLGPADPVGVATVGVTFLARPAVVGLIEAGHVDVSLPGVADERRAALLSVTAPQQTTATTRLETVQTTATTSRETWEFQEAMVTFGATLRVPVVLMPTGWFYGNRPLRVGAPFQFDGPTYTMTGWILNVQVTPASQELPR